MTSPDSASPAARCASCDAPATGGRFCSNCGVPYAGAMCAACRSELTPGAQFCHRCGTAVGATTPPKTARARTTVLPWAISAIALLALVGVVVGRNMAAASVGRGSAGDANAAPMMTPSDSTAPQDSATAGMRAPDISGMSARDRADRLYDRVMRLNAEGKRDSVQFFAPMVLAAYQMAGPLDNDQHYDLGLIGQVTGVPDLAKAEADTILGSSPMHLLGLILEAQVAASANQPAVARKFYQRLIAAEPEELKKNLPEYDRHRPDIESAMATARKLGVHNAGMSRLY